MYMIQRKCTFVKYKQKNFTGLVDYLSFLTPAQIFYSEDTYQRLIDIGKHSIVLHIHDTAGLVKIYYFFSFYQIQSQSEYALLQENYIRQGDGFMIIYSIEDQSSFDAIE
jgi:hypothetical protein